MCIRDRSRLSGNARIDLGLSLNPSEYAKKTFGMFPGDEKNVEVRFDESLIGAVIDRFGKDTFIIDENNGYFRAVLKVAVSNSFLSWLFQFGGKAVILAPDEVIDQMKSLLNKVQNRYEK